MILDCSLHGLFPFLFWDDAFTGTPSLLLLRSQENFTSTIANTPLSSLLFGLLKHQPWKICQRSL